MSGTDTLAAQSEGPLTRPRGHNERETMTPSIGRVIHVNINDNADQEPIWRPAVVTQAWSDTCVSCTVTLDPANDAYRDPAAAGLVVSPDKFFASGSSLPLGEGPGEWRWPPRV